MNKRRVFARPHTLVEVAAQTGSLADFGANLRDWQHHIQRDGVHARKGLAACIVEAPIRLRGKFEGGDIADAYLAAYAEWLADRTDIARPKWCRDRTRVADKPWFATPLRGHLLVVSPASFRQRNLFTVPENVFTARPGRPRVSHAHKLEKARLRQKAYRQRIRTLVRQARAMGSHEKR